MEESKAKRYVSSTDRYAAYDKRQKRLKAESDKKIEKLMAACSYALK